MIPGARRLANSAVCKSSPADHLLQILMSAKQFHGIDFLEFSTAAFVNTVCKKAINFSFQMLCIFFLRRTFPNTGVHHTHMRQEDDHFL